eukprot:9546052-Alexandrium_andersonii.AAC.1
MPHRMDLREVVNELPDHVLRFFTGMAPTHPPPSALVQKVAVTGLNLGTMCTRQFEIRTLSILAAPEPEYVKQVVSIAEYAPAGHACPCRTKLWLSRADVICV